MEGDGFDQSVHEFFMLNVIRSAIHLDVVELLPVVSDADLVLQRVLSPPRGWRRLLVRSRLVRFLAFLGSLLRALPRRGQAMDATGAVLLAAFTINQRRALAPLHERLEHAHAPVRFLDGQQPSSAYQTLLRRSFLFAVPFFPMLVFRMFSSRGFRWKSFAWGLDRYWQAYGAYVTVRRWFQKQPPRAVVVANDHTFWPRILIIAAQAEGIPTIYVQHAQIAFHRY
jgi:hypothetical protein